MPKRRMHVIKENWGNVAQLAGLGGTPMGLITLTQLLLTFYIFPFLSSFPPWMIYYYYYCCFYY